MDSNKHGAMEWNEEHIQTNNLIYYTPKTELRMQSYDAMKNAKNNAELDRKLEHGKTYLRRHVCELDALTTRHCMTN